MTNRQIALIAAVLYAVALAIEKTGWTASGTIKNATAFLEWLDGKR